MNLFGWFNKDKVKVRKTKHPYTDGMAAGNPTGAAKALKDSLSPTKILVVGEGTHSDLMVNYALKMAERLDCGLVVLDASDDPLNVPKDAIVKSIDNFKYLASNNSKHIINEAINRGIDVTYVVKLMDIDTAIAQLSREDAGIRYVLTEPDPEIVAAPRVPVFDLACSNL